MDNSFIIVTIEGTPNACPNDYHNTMSCKHCFQTLEVCFYGTKCPDTTISIEYFKTLGTINDQCVLNDVYGCGNLASFGKGGRSNCK